MFKNVRSKIDKRIYILLIIASCDVLFFVVPSYLKNVIPSNDISKYLGIYPSQFSQAIAICGYVSLFGYVFGGIFADRCSLKKLVFWSMIFCGLFDLWYGFIPFIQTWKAIQVYIIFGGWSFVKSFFFWSALWKLLSQQGTKKENGYLNGMEGSLNGIVGTIMLIFVYSIFYLFANTFANILGKYAFSTLIFILVIAIFINAFLIAKFVPEYKGNDQEGQQKIEINIKDIFKTIKNLKLLIVTFLIMGVYMYQTGLSIYMNYLDSLAIPAIIIVVVGLFRTYILRSVVSIPAGKIGDKSQKYILMIVCGLFISTCLMIVAIVLPGFGENINNLSPIWKITIQVFTTAFFLCLGALSWFLVTNRWATIYEINISQKEYAMSVGFISFIAFSPDAWFWQLDAIIQNHFNVWNADHTEVISTKISNQISLSIICVIGTLAMIAGIFLLYFMRREKNRLKARTINKI